MMQVIDKTVVTANHLINNELAVLLYDYDI